MDNPNVDYQARLAFEAVLRDTIKRAVDVSAEPDVSEARNAAAVAVAMAAQRAHNAIDELINAQLNLAFTE